MDITLERVVPITEESFERLRRAPLENAGGEEIFIYHNATFRIADLWPDALNPTSLYLLRYKIEFQKQLNAHLLREYNIDTLALDSVLLLENAGALFGMAPLWVEIFKERTRLIPLPGDRTPPPESTLRVPILKDGLHRAAIAREWRRTVRCLEIHGALEGYPPYAYPNSWDEVVVRDDIPAVKKFYRRHDPHSFMRPIRVLRSAAGAPPTTEYGRTN